MVAWVGSIARIAKVGTLLRGAGVEEPGALVLVRDRRGLEDDYGIDLGDGEVIWANDSELETPTTEEVAMEIFSRRDEIAALKAQIETLKAAKKDGPIGPGTLFRLEARREPGGILEAEFLAHDGTRLSMSITSSICTREDAHRLAEALLRSAGMIPRPGRV